MNLFSEPSLYHTWLRNGAYAAPAILFGLLVIWSLFSQARWLRRHWYLRIAIPLTAVALLLPTRMCETALYGLLTLGIVVLEVFLLRAAIRCWRYLWRRRVTNSVAYAEFESTELRFGLSDALIAMSLTAVALAVGSYAARNIEYLYWSPLLFASFAYGNLLIITAGAAFIRIRFRWIQLAMFVLWFPLAFALCYLWAYIDWLAMLGQYDWSPLRVFETTAFNVSADSAIGLLVVMPLYRFAFVPARDSGQQSTPRRWLAFGARSFSGVVLLVILAPVVFASMWLFVLLLEPVPQTTDVFVEGNVYNELMAALEKLESHPGPDPNTVLRDELQATLEEHHAALAEVESALGRPCRRILPYGPDAMMKIVAIINGPRCFARIKLAHGRFLESDGDFVGAVQQYMQAVELAEAYRQGGVRIDVLLGAAFEDMGLEGLRGVRDNLDSQTCRRLSIRLQQIDAQQESWQLIDQRDRAWDLHAGGDSMRLAYAIDAMIGSGSFAPMQSAYSSVTGTNTKRRLLMVELALLAYQQEQGEYPDSLDSLVPDYLNAVPIDPFSKRPLIYRREGDGFILYSVGLDGVDNGGMFVSRFQAVVEGEGDYFLDASDLDDAEENP